MGTLLYFIKDISKIKCTFLVIKTTIEQTEHGSFMHHISSYIFLLFIKQDKLSTTFTMIQRTSLKDNANDGSNKTNNVAYGRFFEKL